MAAWLDFLRDMFPGAAVVFLFLCLYFPEIPEAIADRIRGDK